MFVAVFVLVVVFDLVAFVQSPRHGEAGEFAAAMAAAQGGQGEQPATMFTLTFVVFILVFDLVMLAQPVRDARPGKHAAATVAACCRKKEKTREAMIFVALILVAFHVLVLVETVCNRGSREQTAPTPASCGREKKEPR